ncbi:hypothetical protein Q7A53_05770 [Halobacillus rhizosphaerae]|uniref:hypothetical protein n=1 Tax=Halobacillus rhizosphaerae TaxID=3064889 RepID=UPI00398A89E3
MNEIETFDKAYKEFTTLYNRYKFINYDLSFFMFDESKKKVSELVFWADWELDQIRFNEQDELIQRLEEAGRSQKQIEQMEERAMKALGKFIAKWSDENVTNR